MDTVKPNAGYIVDHFFPFNKMGKLVGLEVMMQAVVSLVD